MSTSFQPRPPQRRNRGYALPSLPIQDEYEDHAGYYRFEAMESDVSARAVDGRRWTTAATAEPLMNVNFGESLQSVVQLNGQAGEIPEEFVNRTRILNDELCARDRLWEDMLDDYNSALDAMLEKVKYDEQWERDAIDRDADESYAKICRDLFNSVFVEAMEFEEDERRRDALQCYVFAAMMRMPAEEWASRAVIEKEERELFESMDAQWLIEWRPMYAQHRHHVTRARLALYEGDAWERLVIAAWKDRSRRAIMTEERDRREMMMLDSQVSLQMLYLHGVSEGKCNMFIEWSLPAGFTATMQLNGAAATIQALARGVAVRKSSKQLQM